MELAWAAGGKLARGGELGANTSGRQGREAKGAMDQFSKAVDAFAESIGHVLLPRLLSCAVIVIAGLIALKAGKSIIKRGFERGRQAKKGGAGVKKLDTAMTISLSLYKYAVSAIAALMLLQTFGINLASVLAVAGIGGLAIGIGAQSLVKDLLNGLLIWFEDQYAVGDAVTVTGLSGVVEDFSLRATKIRGLNGDLHIIPNSEIHSVTNSSKGFKRVIFDVGMPPGCDPDRVIGILESELAEAKKAVPGMAGDARVLGIQSCQESEVSIRLVAACDPGACYDVERAMRRRLTERLRAEGVGAPFPAITVSGK
jgi:small conductance mechanosensitive channel